VIAEAADFIGPALNTFQISTLLALQSDEVGDPVDPLGDCGHVGDLLICHGVTRRNVKHNITIAITPITSRIFALPCIIFAPLVFGLFSINLSAMTNTTCLASK